MGLFRRETSRRRRPGEQLRIALLAVLVLSVTAACGANPEASSDASPETESPSELTSEPSEESTPTAELTRVRYLVGRTPTLGLPLYAISDGIFEKHGIDAQPIEGDAAANAVAALLAGDAEVGHFGGATVIAANAEGADLMYISAGVASGNVVVLRSGLSEELGVTEESELDDRIAALKGLTIATASAGSGTEALLKSLLEHGGLDSERDVTLVNLSDPAALQAGLEGGLYDAAAHGVGIGLEVAVEEGLAEPLISPQTLDVAELNLLSSVTFGRREWVEENPEAATALHEALAEAYSIYVERPDHVKEVVQENWFPDQDEASFDAVFPPSAATWIEGAVIPRDLVENTIAVVKASGVDTSGMTYESLTFEPARSE